MQLLELLEKAEWVIGQERWTWWIQSFRPWCVAQYFETLWKTVLIFQHWVIDVYKFSPCNTSSGWTNVSVWCQLLSEWLVLCHFFCVFKQLACFQWMSCLMKLSQNTTSCLQWLTRGLSWANTYVKVFLQSQNWHVKMKKWYWKFVIVCTLQWRDFWNWLQNQLNK